MATNAQKFNVSKKIAQLTRVSFLFGSQLEERKYQKAYLNEIYNQKISEVLSDYTAKATKIIEEGKPEQSIIESDYKNRYQKLYDQLLEDIKQYQQQNADKVNEQCDSVSTFINEIIQEFPKIIDIISENVNNFNNFSIQNKENLKTKCEEMKKLHKIEIENHEKESQQRLQQCTKDARTKIEALRAEHEKTIQSINSERNIKQRNDEQLAQLQVKKDRLTSLSKVIYPAFEEAHKLSRSYDAFSKANKDVVFKYKALAEIIPKNEEVEKFKEEIEKQNIQNKDVEKKYNDEIAATKASNEFKLNKLKKDIEAQIKQIEDQYQSDSSQYSAANSAYVAELNELTQKMKEEMSALKDCIASKEECCKQIESQLEQDIASEKKNAKTAKNNKNKKLAKTKTTNQKDYENAQQEYSSNEKELKDKLDSERHIFKQEVDKMAKGGSEALHAKQKELSQLNLEKAAAEEAAKSKISNAKVVAEEKIKAQLESFRSLESITQEDLNNEFEKAKIITEDKINDLINNCRSKEKEYAQQMEHNIETELSKIKEAGYDLSEYEALLKEYTEQFQELKNKLDDILPPSSTGKFDTLEKEISTLELEKTNIIEQAANSKSQMAKEFNISIDKENTRHKSTITSKASGRNKEQFLQSLQMQITDCKKQCEKESDELKKILNTDFENHQKDLHQLELLRSKAEMANEIRDLKQILSNTINQQAETLENLQGSANLQIERMNQKISDLQKDYEEKIRKFNKEQANLQSDFQLELPQYQKELDNAKIEGESEYETESKNGQLKLERERTNQLQRTSEIKRRTDSVRQSIQNSNDAARRSLASSQSRRRDRVDSASDEYQKKLEKMRVDWKGMLAFYDESISVLQKKIEELASNYDSRESRQCDIERITELSADLKQKTYFLKVLLQDFASYKKLIIQQEKEYNRHFGVSPRIGTLSCGV